MHVLLVELIMGKVPDGQLIMHVIFKKNAPTGQLVQLFRAGPTHVVQLGSQAVQFKLVRLAKVPAGHV
jgi:hypothetical protein